MESVRSVQQGPHTTTRPRLTLDKRAERDAVQRPQLARRHGAHGGGAGHVVHERQLAKEAARAVVRHLLGALAVAVVLEHVELALVHDEQMLGLRVALHDHIVVGFQVQGLHALEQLQPIVLVQMRKEQRALGHVLLGPAPRRWSAGCTVASSTATSSLVAVSGSSVWRVKCTSAAASSRSGSALIAPRLRAGGGG